MNTVIILALTIFNPFADGYSVATAQRSQALFFNPAGLAVNPGFELFYNIQIRESANRHQSCFSLGPVGFGTRMMQDSNFYYAGMGFPLFSKSLYLGYGRGFGSSSNHNLGAIFRPVRFISLGANVKIDSRVEARFGFGLRPLTDRLTLFGDAVYQDSLANLYFGGAVEPFPGWSSPVKQTGI